jgi:hypothetical protein
MNKLAAKFRGVWNFAVFLVFQVFMLFWVITIALCIYGYLTKGVPGVLHVFLHSAPIPANPNEWGQPRWDLIIVRYAVIAAITVGLGFINARRLRGIWEDIRRSIGD